MFSNNKTTKELIDIKTILDDKNGKRNVPTHSKLLLIKSEIEKELGNKKLEKLYIESSEKILNEGKQLKEILYYDLKFITEKEYQTLNITPNFIKGLTLIIARREKESKNNLMFYLNFIIKPIAIALILVLTYDYIYNFLLELVEVVYSLNQYSEMKVPFPYGNKLLMNIYLIFVISIVIFYYLSKIIFYKYFPYYYLKIWKKDMYEKLENLFNTLKLFNEADVPNSKALLNMKENANCYIDKKTYSMLYYTYINEDNEYDISKGMTFSDILKKLGYSPEIFILIKTGEGIKGGFWDYTDSALNSIKIKKEYESLKMKFILNSYNIFNFFILMGLISWISIWMSVFYSFEIYDASQQLG